MDFLEGHSFIQLIPLEHLQCARHCPRGWGQSSEQHKDPCSRGAYFPGKSFLQGYDGGKYMTIAQVPVKVAPYSRGG